MAARFVEQARAVTGQPAHADRQNSQFEPGPFADEVPGQHADQTGHNRADDAEQQTRFARRIRLRPRRTSGT